MVPSGAMWRTRSLPRSATAIVPSASTATSTGWNSRALVAAPPSPSKPGSPVPAIVVSLPCASTRWTTLPSLSAISTEPSASTSIPAGCRSPSGPASVRILPSAPTARIWWLPPSAMTKPPPGSAATSTGFCSAVPLPSTPAAVVISPPASTARMRALALSAISQPPPGTAASPRGAFSHALVAATASSVSR